MLQFLRGFVALFRSEEPIENVCRGLGRLEDRILMSATPATLAVEYGELVIEGSDRKDRIAVEVSIGDNGQAKIDATVNGVTTSFLAEVWGMRIESGAGNDKVDVSISVDNSDPFWVMVDGGVGKDVIDYHSTVLPSSFQIVRGGEGNDKITALDTYGSPWHNLYGDDGNDKITTYVGAYLLGGTGNDTLTSFSRDHSYLDGGIGRNKMRSHYGDTTFIVSGIADRIDGGTGDDYVAIYSVGTSASRITFNGGAGFDTLAVPTFGVEKLRYKNVENVFVYDLFGKG